MEAYYACSRCKNQRVRLWTVDGRQYEGVVVNVDRNNVYLKPDGKGEVKTTAFYPNTYNEDILTLSLFVLLAIVLI
ncbi:hypothetical protein D3C75_1163130 [compost metagenome]